MKERLPIMGAMATGVLASLCCIGPLLFLALGLGGAGFFLAFERYHPVFLGLTFLFLGAAFYLEYRPRQMATEKGECSPEECEPSPASRARRWGLWLAAVVVLFLAFFKDLRPFLGI